MPPRARRDDLADLLAEQVAYYRAVAPEYDTSAIPDFPIDDLVRGGDAMVAALKDFRPEGEVLELACGPGTWTPHLLTHATSVTALDTSPEMLRKAVSRTRSDRVRFVQADVFAWEPDRHYDVVFFGFWLSHVPMERFESFWGLVDQCLKLDGRVAFADDGYREPDELIEGEASSVIRRQVASGASFRAVKVPHTPQTLEKQLHALGWAISVRYVGGPFFWGSGARTDAGAANQAEAGPTDRGRVPQAPRG